MSFTLKNGIKVALVGGSLAFLAGCATNADQDRLMMMVQDAQSTADEALSAAGDANSMAMQADATAREAQAMANENSQRINELDEKIDRMFERSMAK